MWPMLLDTCALQHLKYVSERLDDNSYLGDEEADLIHRRFGSRFGDEIVALGDLVSVLHHNGPAWLISETSLVEFERAPARKKDALRRWWSEWADYMHGCIDADWYPEIDVESLSIQHGPDVHEH